MKNIIAIILCIIFSICCAYAQDCLPKLIKASKDTTFTVDDSNLLLIERPTSDTYEVTMTFRKIAHIVTTVNNTELTFTGLWEHPSGAWGDVSHSSHVGATAKCSFTGNKVEVISDLAPGHGTLGYTINSGSEKTVSLFAAVRKNGQVVISELAPAGFNTITLRCISGTVLIDKLIVTR